MSLSKRIAHGWIVLAILAVFGGATPLFAQQQVFQIDPAQSQVKFSLDAGIHTVHGNFRLKTGHIEFDQSTGLAGGEMVVEAETGDSGNKGRDHKMKQDVLETQKYQEITFTPQRVKGKIALEGLSQVDVDGIMNMHGQPHQMTLAIRVTVKDGSASADTSFEVPYVKWGMKDPSAFILRVSKKVDITVHAVGQLTVVNK